MSHTLIMEKSTQGELATKGNNKITWEYLDRNRFGLMVVLILVVGCMAGIAVGLGALTQVVSLSVLALTTMTALSMMLALAPIKILLYTSIIAVVTDIIIIIVNFII